MMLSIITINYNNAEGLENTINSVICQDFKDYEYIIIDGGSTDGSVDIIKRHSQCFTFWVSEPDKGIYNAMNKGVKHSSGEYCIFMNSGDIFYNKDVIKNVFSNGYTEDIITGVTIGKDENNICFDTKREVTFLTLYRSTISHQASFIKTALLHKFPYSEDLKIVSDWEFWIKTIILDNCSHIFDSNIVAKIDQTGISVIDNQGREKERSIVLRRNIPERILENFKPLKYADDKMIEYVAKISKTYRLHKITSFILNIICKLIK